MDYRPALRRNFPEPFIRAYLSGVPNVYKRAHDDARSRYGGNVAYHRGTGRWQLSDDLLYGSAQMAGQLARRVSSNNSMSHVEVYSPEFIVIQGKTDAPSKPRSAQFITQLLSDADQGRLFEEELVDKVEREAGDERRIVQLLHTPDPEDPSQVLSITAAVMGTDGEIIQSFPLSTLYGGESADEGVENVPDNVITPPKSGSATGTAP